MFKKIIVVLFFSIILLGLFGCRIGPTDRTKGEIITPSEVEFHKGIQGLIMEFLSGQPASSVWENSDFPITVKIQNKGANDIQRGILTITGNLYFSTVDDLQFSLEGKSEFNPEGEFSFEKFPATAVAVDEEKTDSFFVIACYQYRTSASYEICINPRVFGEEVDDGECRVGAVSSTSGQGAPVTVTEVEEEIIPIGENKLRINFKIHVADKGNGRVVAYDSYMKGCGGHPISLQEVGEVRVDNIQFSNYVFVGDVAGITERGIICPNLNNNKFRFDPSGQFVIECFADLDTENIGPISFTTPLITELSYGYTQLSEQKTIIIKNSPNNN